MAFFQDPPRLGNQYDEDRVLRAYLERALPRDVKSAIEPELRDMGELAVAMYDAFLADYKAEPKLSSFDAWGHRVEKLELTPLWQWASKVAAEKGVVATAYEKKHREHARVHQFALAYLFDPSTAVYTCPLAMTDGAAKTLSVLKNQALVDRALPHLLSRDPKAAWTSGQWMTERTGGSDVAISETVAKKDGDAWRLYGTKWFTSATTSQMALTLARPEGNPPGGSGLALFYLEVRDAKGEMNHIAINRLKDKLGTRQVPTAELTLDGARAIPVVGLTDGIKNITPMLNITRTWNSVAAIAFMRRSIALSRDFARRRVAFGAPLADKPLHVDTLAGLQAEFEGAFLLTFRAVELLGREENGVLTEAEAALMRLLTPITKLTTGKQAVAITSEALEAFGGAGYIEDTGLPRLMRDAQVLPIWEGTTNVLSLDLLRAIGRGGKVDVIESEIARLVAAPASEEAAHLGGIARAAATEARRWLERTAPEGIPALEAGARRFALTLGRALELALLVEQGSWAMRTHQDPRTLFAAKRFARHGVNLLQPDIVSSESARLARDD